MRMPVVGGAVSDNQGWTVVSRYNACISCGENDTII